MNTPLNKDVELIVTVRVHRDAELATVLTGVRASLGGDPGVSVRLAMPAGLREDWQPGDRAWFEYHCWEDDESADARLWHRSHQQVTVTGRGAGDDFPGTFAERAEAGMPRVHAIRFADGLEATAFEDELLTGPGYYQRPDPPGKMHQPVLRHGLVINVSDRLHKAEPRPPDSDPLVCKDCGELVMRVPGGHGPVWVHAVSQMVWGTRNEQLDRLVDTAVDLMGSQQAMPDEGSLAHLAAIVRQAYALGKRERQ